MPIVVELRDENGKVLEVTGESVGAVPVYLPSLLGDEFLMIRYIDPYGDTVFNPLQMEPVISDLNLLRERARGDRQRQLVDAVIALARKCRSTPHTYLVFVGD